MRKQTRAMALILAAIWLLALCPAGIAEGEDDPVVVRVGNFTYPLSLVQSTLTSTLDLAGVITQTEITEEDREAGVQATIEKFINMGVIESKLAEAGRNDFTDEEIELMKSAAQSKYEELWQALYQRASQQDEEVSEEDITSWLEAAGYTMEAIYDEYVVLERSNRAMDMYCQDVVINRQQADDYYEQQFVAPERERYANDISLFESEIVMSGSEPFYTPAGYRYIRQIALDYPDEATSAAKAMQARYTNAAQKMASAFQKLAVAATTAEGWDDLKDLRQAYDEASEQLMAERDAYVEKLRQEAQPLLQATFDAIFERYRAGIDFKTLIETYSQDKTDRNLSTDGYLFHPDSETWPDAFVEAALTLEKPGDISDPVYSETGVHILYYAGEAPEGAHVLTEEEQEQLDASALQYYKNERLQELIAGWKADYEIETHPEMLEY